MPAESDELILNYESDHENEVHDLDAKTGKQVVSATSTKLSSVPNIKGQKDGQKEGPIISRSATDRNSVIASTLQVRPPRKRISPPPANDRMLERRHGGGSSPTKRRVFITTGSSNGYSGSSTARGVSSSGRGRHVPYRRRCSRSPIQQRRSKSRSRSPHRFWFVVLCANYD